MEAKIIFKDGTDITAEKNADCYIINSKPEFPEDLSNIIIESEEGNKEFEHALLIECAGTDKRYWFAFIEESPYDRTIRELCEENEMLENAIVELAEIIGG